MCHNTEGVLLYLIREGASSPGAVGDPRPLTGSPVSTVSSPDSGMFAGSPVSTASGMQEHNLQQLLGASRSASPADSDTSGIGSECSTDTNLIELMVKFECVLWHKSH